MKFRRRFVRVISRAAILLCCACCWFICGNNRDKQQNSAIDTLNRTRAISIKDTLIGVSDAIRSLREKYQEYKVTYYNDLNYLGIGVVNPKRFDFQFVTDTVTGDGLKLDNIEEQEYLIPMLWKPDYQIFYMPVIDSSGGYYAVRANKETNVFVNKCDFDFYTWEELFTKRAISVVAEKGYMKQDIESESVAIDDRSVSLIVEKYDGDWLLVNEESDDGVRRNVYWVKWRDKNKLSAKPVFLM